MIPNGAAVFSMICTLLSASAFHAHATTIGYTLDNVILADGAAITGTFDWTYSVGDFEGGSGTFSVLEIPYTPYSFAAGNLNIDIQTNAIEISGNGNYHDMGLDITLRLSPPLLHTQSARIDTDPTQSFFECCGNGFKDQPFQSGRVVPTAFLVGDFGIDGDVDGFDFLRWQIGVSTPPWDVSDFAAWEANFGTTSQALGTMPVLVPEPGFLGLLVIGFAGMTNLAKLRRR